MKVKCWWLIDPIHKLIPIFIRITNPENNLSMIKSALFDTAYSGYCGLDYDTIKTLKLPKIGGGKARTVAGDVDFENYFGIIDILTPEQSPIKRIELIEEDKEQLKELLKIDKQSIIIQKLDLTLLGMKAICQSNWVIISSENLFGMLETSETK